MKENYLEYSSLIKYAIDNIYKIKKVEDVTLKFLDFIEDITKVAHDRIDEVNQISLFHKYIGQENYVFKFKEDENSWGEFSLDFLPINAKEHAIKSLLDDNYSGEKRLANFRIQLFSNIDLKEKYEDILEYITKIYGKPNSSPEVIEFINILEGESNKKINGWHFSIEDTDYFISYYHYGSIIESRSSYISFSISEYMEN